MHHKLMTFLLLAMLAGCAQPQLEQPKANGAYLVIEGGAAWAVLVRDGKRVEVVETRIGIHRARAPSVDDQQRLAIGIGGQRRRIPSRRDVADQIVRPRVDDAHRIEIAERCIQRLFIGREREPRRRNAGKIRDVGRPQQDRRLHGGPVVLDVDDRDRIASGVGDIQERLRAVEEERRRLAQIFYLRGQDDIARIGGIQNGDRAIPLARDIGPRPVGFRDDGIRK